MQRQIYSIGHSNRESKELISLLKNYGIRVVIDIRRFPTSRWKRFKKEGLKRELKAHNIEYRHLEALGGFRGGYREWMRSEKWKNAYRKLKELALRKITAFMCAERYPFRCHRRWVARMLNKDGWQVVHILNDRKWVEKGR